MDPVNANAFLTLTFLRGGEDLTMAGRTNNERQEKKELLSQWILEG